MVTNPDEDEHRGSCCLSQENDNGERPARDVARSNRIRPLFHAIGASL